MGRRLLGSFVALAMSLVSLPFGSTPAAAISADLVISQVYGGGGNSGAPFISDYIEIFNRGTSAVSLAGYSLQYASATGTGNFGASATQITELPSGALAPGQYFLVQEASGTAGLALPAPDLVDATPINMSATGGKVAIVTGITSLGCNGGSAPCSGAQVARIVDFIGYDGANFFEGSSPAPALSNTTAAFRASEGCRDTDDNGADFFASAPAPRNALTPLHLCVTDSPPTVVSTSPANGASGVPLAANVGVTFSEPVNVTGSWYSITCATSGVHTAVVTGGPTTYTIDPDAGFAYNESCTIVISGAFVSDQDAADPPDQMPGDYTFSFTAVTAPLIVISQVYGGGGNTGATWKNDFIELYNRGTSTVDLTGWSVQYAASAGTTWQGTPLNGVLAPGTYYLVQEAAGSGGTTTLPTPDAVGTIAMSATSGKVALISSGVLPTGSCPTVSGVTVYDLVGYGTAATCFEGSGPTANLSNTTAALRINGGATDTNNNASDFVVAAPTPRNSQGDSAPAVSATSPAAGAADVAADANITITFSEAVNVSGSWFDISCTASGNHTATASGGPTTFTLDPTTNLATAETCTVTVFAAQVSDQDSIDPPDTMAQNAAWSFATISPPIFIHDIQGATHISPRVGTTVKVTGIVTAKRSNGFYLQEPDAEADADDATSEGIFVFTSSAPASVSVGDALTVSGTVSEFRPGGAATGNLTTTEISGPTILVQSSGNPLPTPTVIGAGGRVPPTEVIENDASPDVETSGVFDPSQDGIDFWESLEGMLVTIQNPAIVGPSNNFNEISVLADGGVGATGRTARGGIAISATDKNPEKVVLDDEILKLQGIPFPTDINVGDSFAGSVTGVIDYNFGLFLVELTAAPTKVPGALAREIAGEPAPQELAIATFNVENLDPGDGAAAFARMANLIVNNLRSPDVISLEEIQDNNGPTNDSTVDATATLTLLRDAVIAAGGPTYSWREIDPVDDQDGGEPGGNIRQAFFYRTDRGLAFVDRPGATSTTSNTVVNAGGPQLLYSPGRIDPTNSAFNSSRKPLAAEFTYNGHRLFVVANHFNSKGGDDPLWGRHQPPNLASELQRQQQANIVKGFAQQILGLDTNAEVVVLGDLNDFEWSNPLMTLKSTPGRLNDLIETLPVNERYTYVFEGNSQTLDHILVSDRLLGLGARTDVVHVNAEFWDQASDHDPQVAMLPLRDTVPPTFTFVPPDQTYFTGPAATTCAVFVSDDTLGVPTASDNAGGVSITRSGVPAGNLFPCGVTVITYVATDDAGNTSSATQRITVVDNTPPTITTSGNVVVRTSELNGQCTALVLTGATATDNSGLVTINASGVPAGNIYPLGTTTVTYTATDPAGNAATATQTVTVIDDTRPTIAAPSNVTRFASGVTTFISDADLGTATAADNCGNVTIARSGVPAGNLFPHGITTITYTATDPSGNTATATQTVTVNATSASVCATVRSYIASAGVANSLCTQLDSAAAARARGNVNAHDNLIDAFTSEVGALQRNGTLTAGQAEQLITLARAI